MKTIPLSSLIPLPDLSLYKAHMAIWNTEHHPLDVFVRDRAEWDTWNSYRGTRDHFNRERIISFINFYPEPNTYLFGGIYEVLDRSEVQREHSYTIRRLPNFEELIGRLKINFKNSGRNHILRLENCYEVMTVSELLKEPYTGELFPGYENISVDFSMLEALILSGRPDWRSALANVKGVYLITDKSNAMRYVGSAYGEEGIWSRWAGYNSGHGDNQQLVDLIKEKTIDHARKYFRFTLLEYRNFRVEDSEIIARENFWKEALQTRRPWGYNSN